MTTQVCTKWRMWPFYWALSLALRLNAATYKLVVVTHAWLLLALVLV